MRRKCRLLAIGVAATLAYRLGLALTMQSALADVVSNVTVGVPPAYVNPNNSTNGSDPDVEPCTFGGQTGYCLYTSQDVPGQKQIGNNSYPMNVTRGYFLTDGINWTPEGNVNGVQGNIFSETQYPWAAGNDHLWAPDGYRAADGNYYLLVPDVTSLSTQDTSSVIGVSRSTSPFGPFSYANLTLKGDPAVHGGYASDPDVAYDNSGRAYLAYANGDGANCGSLSLASIPADSPTGVSGGQLSAKTITIDNIGALGMTCKTSVSPIITLQQPYMEGPQLYYTPNWGLPGAPGQWLLTFAAAASNGAVPSGCATNQGEPGTGNEVIAYATASSINTASPTFEYQGILMCGSQKEYTDQASIIPMTAQSGNKALVLVYHDGPGGGTPHNRTLHGECLMYGGGKFAAAMRETFNSGTTSGAVNCLENFDAYAWALMPYGNGLLQPNAQVVTTLIGGSSNGQLTAARGAAGPYEKFYLHSDSSNVAFPGAYAETTTETDPYVTWFANANSKYVNSQSQNGVLNANQFDQGLTDVFRLIFNGNGTVTLGSDNDNLGVQPQGATSGSLEANGVLDGMSSRYFALHY